MISFTPISPSPTETAHVDDRLIHADIDRTFIDAGATRWIIDYKSGRHAGGDLEGFLAEEAGRYEPQLSLYRRLFEQMGETNIKTALYLPRHGGVTGSRGKLVKLSSGSPKDLGSADTNFYMLTRTVQQTHQLVGAETSRLVVQHLGDSGARHAKLVGQLLLFLAALAQFLFQRNQQRFTRHHGRSNIRRKAQVFKYIAAAYRHLFVHVIVQSA